MDRTQISRTAASVIAGLLVMLPAPAAAQSIAPASFASFSYGKTEAILGGAPSALAAILAQQQGAGARAPTATASIEPASYSIPPMTNAILRRQPLFSAGVTSGRPDVFGTVALKVGHTSLDARWRRAEHSGLSGAPADYAASLRSLDSVERAETVNRYVNHRVQFVDDIRQYGRNDVWAAAGQTLSSGRGDCEDYAIAKLQMLRRAGVSDRDLYLVIVKDLVRRADHAVLVVRAGGRMLLLDNGTDRVSDTETVRDYRPVFTFAANGTWTHGYRRPMPQVEMASATIAALAPAADSSLVN